MKLIYYLGNNFGDALNPIIFEHLLPGFFSDNSEYEFLGIGSILGMERPNPQTKKFVVFSSGYANGDYGTFPSKKDLEKYDFRCVRGPLTAKAFGLSNKKSVCDGAILLPEVILNTSSNKKYKYAYMPHVESLKKNSHWGELLESIDIKFIDPTKDVHVIIKEIQETEILLSEAMHGAIVADAYRVPWIPIKANPFINEFKWQDFCLSLNMKYIPNMLKPLFDESHIEHAIEHRLHLKPSVMSHVVSKGYSTYQHVVREKKVLKKFEKIKNAKVFMSSDRLLESKKEILLDELHKISQDYKSIS